jgi:ATP-dependent RNA helicase DeaD
MAPRIAKIAERHLDDPVNVLVAREKTAVGSLPKVRQTAYIVARAHKVQALGLVLDLEAPTLALVFCRTRNEVDSLGESLSGRGYRVEALHGGMTQDQRDKVMRKTRGGTVDILVATDVAARGLDIAELTHVVNFDVPQSPQDYVHRIGRTGRAGREGVAITFAEPREHRYLKGIELSTKQKITLAQLPTVLDVRAKKLEITRASVREALLAGDLDAYRVVVEALSGEFDVMDVAAAAVKLAHQAEAGDEQPLADVPEAPMPKGVRRPGGGPRPSANMARIFIGAGRKAKMRPADLVGAIANEAKIEAKDIGAIKIDDRYSLVEISEELVERVITALRAATVKGKRLTVRRDMANRP